MRIQLPIRGMLAMLAAAALLTPANSAQLCQDPSDTFWKNDVLPQNVIGTPPPSSVAVAICATEAVGTYFPMPAGSKPQYIKQVSVGFKHTGGATNFAARLSVEIYEGTVGFNPGGPIAQMGTKIFDLKADTGLEFVVLSDGLNAFDMTPFNVVVDDDYVVAYRMLENVSFPFCPDASPGNPANFMTDSSSSCTPGLNVFDEKFVGWIDPADWEFQFGSPICPQFFAGNFVIRACTTDAGVWSDLGNGLAGTLGVPVLSGSGPLTEGSLNPLVLSNALPQTPTFVIVGFSTINAPLKGGILVPSFDIFFQNIPSGASGGWSLAAPWSPGFPTGFFLYWQVWFPDAGGPSGFAASNAVSSETP